MFTYSCVHLRRRATNSPPSRSHQIAASSASLPGRITAKDDDHHRNHHTSRNYGFTSPVEPLRKANIRVSDGNPCGLGNTVEETWQDRLACPGLESSWLPLLVALGYWHRRSAKQHFTGILEIWVLQLPHTLQNTHVRSIENFEYLGEHMIVGVLCLLDS